MPDSTDGVSWNRDALPPFRADVRRRWVRIMEDIGGHTARWFIDRTDGTWYLAESAERPNLRYRLNAEQRATVERKVFGIGEPAAGEDGPGDSNGYDDPDDPETLPDGSPVDPDDARARLVAELELARRREWGAAALRAGTPDYGQTDPETDLSDALTNLMHYADAAGLDFPAAIERAERDRDAECAGEIA